MLSLLRLERKSKNSWNPFRIRIFLFLSYSFGIETINRFIDSAVPSKTIPDSRPKWAKCFRPKRRKTLPNGAEHTYMAYIREYPLPPDHLTPKKQNLYLRRRNSKSGIIIALAGLKTSTDNADRLLNASLSLGRPHNVRVCRLLLYGKCTGVTVCFTYSDISLSMSVNQY